MADVSTIGKYEIRRELGRGAMGVVYEAFDPVIKRVVALKTVRPDQLAGEDAASMLARFRREAQAAGRLNHPNVVSIYDFGEENGVSYIAMEFVNGRELKSYFEANERFRMPEIVRIMGELLTALDYSHKQGVIHRDIKPANVFILPDGKVKVADFGIAHVEASSLTQVGTVLGTPAYMSPEQILGLPVDGRSDLFSAGVILYQFLTGEKPFAGSSTTTMQKVLKEDPLPPSTLNVQVVPGMDAVVRKVLSKRPEDRYATAQEFAEAIVAAAPGAAPARTPAGTFAGNAEATVLATAAPAASATAPQAAALPPSAPPPAPSTPAAARGPLVPIVVVASAILIGAAAWFWYQRTSVPPAPPASGPTAATKAPAAATTPAASTAAPAASTAAAPPDPGTLVISAVGLVDPTDPRYQNDKTLLAADLRADSKSQAVEKALGLMVDAGSLAKNYEWLRDRVLAQSGSFVKTVVRESEPRTGKDGLVSMTADAVVNVRALQKTLNQMSRDERVQLIRASGDPKISVAITVRDADRADAPPIPSPIAENLLKERIKAFGFRTWSEGSAGPNDRGADFAVQGEAKIKKLSIRLEASGVVLSKYALTSWTVKCTDRATGEELYYNNTLPAGAGSWNTEEEALRAIGARIADEFSRDFFLQNANVSWQKIRLAVQGMPDAASEDLVARELVGLADVLALAPVPGAKPRAFDLQLAGSGNPAERVAAGIVRPLNAKLGRACFGPGSSTAEQVTIVFDPACADKSVLGRLETNPPAALYGAPPARQKGVVRNPDTLRKLAI